MKKRRRAWGAATMWFGLVLFGALRLAEAADWPSFRGTADLTGVAASALPDRLELLWTHEAGSAVASTAAIVGDRVFVGTDKGAVLCLGLADGKRVWKFDAGGAVSASPCVVDGRVYVGDEDGTFYALNAATGAKAWQFKTEGKIVSSATPAAGTVFFGSYDNLLYCLDAKTGEKKWALEVGSYVHPTPCVIGDRVVTAGCDGVVRVLEAATGKEITRAAVVEAPADKEDKENPMAAVQGTFAACPAHKDNDVFIADMTGRFYRINLEDARLIWTHKEEGGGECYAGPAVLDDSVVFAGGTANKVFCLDREKGKVLWTFETKDRVHSSPVIAGGTVLFGCADGTLRRLRLKDGKELWKFAAGAEVSASPAVASGRLVIGTQDGAVYCFGEKKPPRPPAK